MTGFILDELCRLELKLLKFGLLFNLTAKLYMNSL